MAPYPMDQESALIQQLRRTLGRMEAAMGAIHDALAISDDKGRVLWCNEPFLSLVARPRLQCLGRTITELLPRTESGDPLLPAIDSSEFTEGSRSRIAELRHNPLQVLEMQWDPIPDEQPPAMVFCLRDISALISYQELWARSESIQQRNREIEHLNARLRRSQQHLAMKVRECPVTGLPNRRGLMEHLEDCIERARQGHHPFAVLFCDLNRFKEVNDNHGHDVGDELLIEISRRLREATRQGDLVSRLGGDEFVVVSHHLQRGSQAQEIAVRLQQAVGQTWSVGHEVLHPSLSIGIAIAEPTAGGDPLSAQELIRRADQAMYAAKAANLSGGRVYDHTLARDSVEASQILLALRQAIAQDSLEIHLQPIVQLGSGLILGHEALVRLPGGGGGLLSPDRFIGHAERSRLIGPLGQQVLAKALQAQRLLPGGDPAPCIAVNVSPLELGEPGFAAGVLDACARSGVDPGLLQLEITETAIIAQPARTAAQLSELREAGIRIHLDDFGTGYSSLSLLSELPVDGIKIDRSFTRALGLDRSRTAVIEAIIRLCRDLGLRVIAEGVESEAQRQLLLSLGCNDGQGYLFGRPGPLDDGRRDPR
ncbi:MAG: putative bifunctional diguanylate cyclase/phosphodiesterase [Cyanobium sp.]